MILMFGIVANIYFVTSSWLIRYFERIIIKANIAISAHIFWIFSFGFCGISFSQTCIVMTANYGNIYVGADSRVNQINANTGVITTYSKCKIIKCGKFFFTAANVYNNQRFNFDLFEIAESVCENESDMFAAVKTIVHEITEPLRKIASRADIVDSVSFRKYISDSGIVQFSIFNVINDIPTIYYVLIRARKNKDGIVSIFPDTTKSRVYKSDCRFIVIGLRNKIEKVLTDDKDFLKTDTINRIRQLIQMEIDADTTGTVEGPINILWIHSDSFEWIDPKPPCPAEQ